MKELLINEGSSKEDLIKFIWKCHRCETDENPRVYMKAIRSVLISLGFSQEWVEGDFRDLMEEQYR